MTNSNTLNFTGSVDKCRKRLHPTSLRLTDGDKKERNVCNFYQAAENASGEKCPYAIPAHIKEIDQEEPVKEIGFFIDALTACRHMESAVIRVHRIISADKKVRKKPWMGSSNCFRLGGRTIFHGYGYAIFSTKALTCVDYYIRKRFFRKDPRKVYTIQGQIHGLKDKKLIAMFQEDGLLADIYLTEVLVREGLAAIFQSLTGSDYNSANAECRCAAQKSKMKALKDGFRLSAAKKEELTRKFGIIPYPAKRDHYSFCKQLGTRPDA